MPRLTESKARAVLGTGMEPHTPGPWLVFGRGLISVITKADKSIVAEVVTHNDRPETKANARLIAAAPDMLAALQFLQREYMSPSSDVLLTDEAKDRIDAAIAKTLGGA